MIRTIDKTILITLILILISNISYAANLRIGQYCSSRMVCYTLQKGGEGLYYFKGEDHKMKYIVQNDKLYGKFFIGDDIYPSEEDKYNYFGNIINSRTFYHENNDEYFFKDGLNLSEAEEVSLSNYPIDLERKLKSSNFMTDAYMGFYSDLSGGLVGNNFQYLDIISLSDSVTIEGIIVNRDNCSGDIMSKNTTLRYGQSVEAIVSCKNLLEVDIYVRHDNKLKVARFTTRIEEMWQKKVF